MSKALEELIQEAAKKAEVSELLDTFQADQLDATNAALQAVMVFIYNNGDDTAKQSMQNINNKWVAESKQLMVGLLETV
jgi:hypothetical protein